MSASLPKVLLLTQYEFPANKRNMNAYQRVTFGSRHARIRLMVRRKNEMSPEIQSCAEVIRSPFQHRWLFLIWCVFKAIQFRFQGWNRILTEPSGFAAVGFLAKNVAGYKWAMDVWDRPRWNTGTHEGDARRPFSDRVVFWIMKRADIYLLSVLPPAAKDMTPPPEKCVQLFNAIDQAQAAPNAPQRQPGGDPILRLVYARSKFHGTMGLDLLVDAAKILRDQKVPFMIHLVGLVPPDQIQMLKDSGVNDCFKVEGFIPETRAEFFRKIHVGLIPYRPYEDLKYIFPIKVLEHLSQGNPVIGSDLPGIAHMVKHEVNGLLVKPGDPADIAKAIARLQSDIALYNRLATEAIRSSARFNPEDKTRLIFEAVIRGSAR